MPKLSSLEKLGQLRAALASGRVGKPRIVVCSGTACQAGASSGIVRAAKKHIIEKRLGDRVSLRVTGCHGFCEMGPFVLTEPQNAFYSKVKAEDIPRIVEALLDGGYVDELLYRDPRTDELYRDRDEIPFFKNQKRAILGLNAKIDPIRIGDSIAQGGYAALERVLARKDPAWVVQEVIRSGLRGRGGAGFPTGKKWELLARQPGRRGKVLVCNADEGDPGAYMDRSVLEGNPQSIIEGMIIGAWGTGAREGVVYVRNEYPVAIRHLAIALRQARDLGLLGPDILGTGFSFDIAVVEGAGAFVCGEETALIRSVEGKTGEPRQRPPFPIEKGIDGKPTVINNVETWANIPLVFRLGAEEYSRIGAPGNSGTKIFSLVGKIKNTGLVEVPMGVSVREIIDDVGGGPVGKAAIKAVQTGGPSGGCIPARMFDLRIDYDGLTKAGSIMGSGGMIVMDENTCMVDIARYFMRFLKEESCGKCFPCRKGTQRMYEILDDIAKGEGTPESVALLEELANAVKDTTMCGLGQTASNPVLSTLRYFRQEYERHVIDKRCDAFVCSDLVGAPCHSACPLGTEPWRYIALLEKGKYEDAYRAIRETNPFPSVCARVCDRQCETRCRLGTSGGEPIAIRALKRFVADRADPSVYRPEPARCNGGKAPEVAVAGAGPAGMAAAHYLSLRGCAVTLFEAEAEPGGMLVGAIPAYRLPRDVLRREIASMLDGRVTLRCGTALGRDLTIDGLFESGFKAVFVSIGAHGSSRLNLSGEDVEGVHPALEFLKAYNLKGEELARGRVGVIGGGNAAVDAARVALRQKDVRSVSLIYRRTYEDMPAYEEEIEAALEEGVTLETMVSPVRIRYMDAAVAEGVRLETLVSPVKICTSGGRITGIECVRNRLGEFDASGRRRPVPVPGTEFSLPLDTLIVAIGERPESEALAAMGLEVDKAGRLVVDARTLRTSREGVFAGGDAVTGPYTVVNAIAAGKRAALAIERHLRGEPLEEPPAIRRPRVFIEPAAGAEEFEGAPRAVPPTLPVEARRKNNSEVELPLSQDEAARESCRCLRCDLRFTQPAGHEASPAASEGRQA